MTYELVYLSELELEIPNNRTAGRPGDKIEWADIKVRDLTVLGFSLTVFVHLSWVSHNFSTRANLTRIRKASQRPTPPDLSPSLAPPPLSATRHTRLAALAHEPRAER